MLRSVVVLLVVALLAVDARRNNNNSRRPPPAAVVSDSCSTALRPCQQAAAAQYPQIMQAAAQGPTALEAAIHSEIRGRSFSIHCANFETMFQCELPIIESNVCRNEPQISGQLPLIRDIKTQFDYLCQPQNTRIVDANINCFTDRSLLHSFQSCPQSAQVTVINQFPNLQTASCRAVLTAFKTSIVSCIGERVNAATACSSARSNGGTHLVQEFTGRLFDAVTRNINVCPPGMPAKQMMARSKKHFKDLLDTYML